MALKEIKTKIAATKRMHTVTRAMEAVSAVKMRKSQQEALMGRGYARAALTILSRLASAKCLMDHPLFQKRTGASKKIALVVITSDKGLAGGLNSGVLRLALRSVQSVARESVTVFAFGRKGEEFFQNRGFTVAEAYENRDDGIDHAHMHSVSKRLLAGFSERAFDEVLVAYSNFRSTFEQVPTVRTLVPLSLPALQSMVEEIIPTRGKYALKTALPAPPDYRMEPDEQEVLSALIPRLVAISLYHSLLEGKASEHSARMVAMKNASDKSKEVTRLLTRTYNKVRQAAITREVSEIVGGREALAD